MRLCHNEFFKENTIRQIAIRGPGRYGDIKDIPDHSELVPSGAMAPNIREFQGLTNRHPIGRKCDSMSARVLKQLIRRVGQMPETRVKLDRIREALKDFIRRQKEGWNSKRRIATAGELK